MQRGEEPEGEVALLLLLPWGGGMKRKNPSRVDWGFDAAAAAVGC